MNIQTQQSRTSFDRLKAGIGFAAVSGVLLALSCNGGTKATVPITYAVEQHRDLPHGLNTVAILDAEMDSAEDQKWSEMAANRVQAKLVEMNDRFGRKLTIVDRKHAKLLADERDLVASGVAQGPQPGSMIKQLGVDAFVVIRMSASEQVIQGKARTITGVDVGALAETLAPPDDRRAGSGRPSGGGRPARQPTRSYPARRGSNPPPVERREGRSAVQTEEVPTVTRVITVRPTFVLLDAVTARAWDTYAPPPITRKEKASVSPIFGSGKTEADLTPRDRVIDEAIETYANDFLQQFFPRDVAIQAEVRSSENALCREGVRLLKAGAQREALEVLRSAVQEQPTDHRAHFALGVALAATGQFDQALESMDRAIALQRDAEYIKIHARLNADRERIYGPATGLTAERAVQNRDRKGASRDTND
ncbi:MAG TPA: tetratricopeptide repeat protein [Phycisphaerae bacterium]